MNHRYILPAIKEPAPGTASVLQLEAQGGISGAGNIDLHCGACNYRLCEGMAPGQMTNIVLRCSKCKSFNAVVDIPKFEALVGMLQEHLQPAQLPKFKKLIKKAVEEEKESVDLIAEIEQLIPDLSWVKDYLVPTNAGEFYGFLSFLLTFLVFYQTIIKKPKQEPKTVINNFYGSIDPYSHVGRNDVCPCGSGEKFKKCHGAKNA